MGLPTIPMCRTVHEKQLERHKVKASETKIGDPFTNYVIHVMLISTYRKNTIHWTLNMSDKLIQCNTLL